MNKVLITSQGRTATLSLSNYLNKLQGVKCFHERNRQDVPFLFYSQMPTYKVLTKLHLVAEDALANQQNSAHYVAVNPYFRFVGPILHEQFNWNVAHIVRHPKTYLESVYKRNTFTNQDVLLNQLPLDTDPFAVHWNSASRFQKLCWYYANTLIFFMQSITTDPKELTKMLSALELPSSATVNGLEVANSAKTLKNKLVGLRQSAGNNAPKNLDWKLLLEQELETYYSLFEPLAKHFDYVL